MIEIVYAVQIVFLCICIYMVHRARFAINGMSRGIILLLALLIVRRFDDALGFMGPIAIAMLSSAVVAVIFLDIYHLYKEREIYALYLLNRKRRIDQLEAMRNESEQSKLWTR